MPTSPQPGIIIQTTITRIGTEGDGVGEFEGFHVIVPKTAIGDKVNCKIKYTTQGRIHANLIEILDRGKSRINPPCEYYNTCGGCSLQHINFDEYKNYKLGLLTSTLKNNNIPLPDSISWFSVGEHSRRRAFVRFDKNGRIGFYEHQSHNVIDIKHCIILEEVLQLLLAPLKTLSMKLGFNIEGWMITNTDSGIDLTLHSENIKIRNESPIFAALVEFARTHKIIRLSWKRGNKFIPVITTAKPILIIAGHNIELPIEYFLQASSSGQEAILNATIVHVDKDAMVLDLFSGMGIYSFAIADKVRRTVAYEIAPEMIEFMDKNIIANKLGDKINAYCRDIEAYPLARDELHRFDTAIINPPRSGALKQVSVLAAGKIAKIIMVSCNSITFARDAKILHEHGYILKNLSAIDQFYYSHHLEQVGVFEIR